MSSENQNDRVPGSRQGMLKITEIFYSLQGESVTTGCPTVFIRLTGCPLRCQYCDSEYAFFGGQWIHYEAILEQVAHYQPKYVCVTGGEPLAQKRCLRLLELLAEQGYTVSLETSGAMDISAVDSRVSRVLDIKTPGSGEQQRNLWENVEHLNSNDQVKFVLCDRSDYEWAAARIAEHQLDSLCEVLFSASHAQLPVANLADWILEDHLPVRFQLQVHKYLWGDVPGH